MEMKLSVCLGAGGGWDATWAQSLVVFAGVGELPLWPFSEAFSPSLGHTDHHHCIPLQLSIPPIAQFLVLRTYPGPHLHFFSSLGIASLT